MLDHVEAVCLAAMTRSPQSDISVTELNKMFDSSVKYLNSRHHLMSS